MINRFTCLVFILILSGCTHKLYVVGNFPQPLIDPLPYSVSIYYDKEFQNYTYTEKGKDREKWIIEGGAAQVQQFNNITSNMFKHSIAITKTDSITTPAETDLILVPKVHSFQYTMPRETNVKIYEVWIKYSISVKDKNGTLIADWIMTSYGKTPSAFLLSDEEAMNQAIVIALRDAGINLALGFHKVAEIDHWLKNNSGDNLPLTDINSRVN